MNFIFDFTLMGCHPNPIDELTPSFFRGVETNHQPDIIINHHEPSLTIINHH
jgi:hypothetical protein